MKNWKWKVASIVLVGGLIAFTVYDTKRTEKNAEKTAASFDMLRLPIDQINSIELIPRTGPHLKLERKDGEWSLVSPIQELADNQEAHNFLFLLKNEKAMDTVVEGPETNLKTYGLDQPPLSIRLGADGGKSEEIKIGAVKAYDSSLYAQVDNEQKVLLVAATWDVILSKTLREFRSKILFRRDNKPDDFNRISIAQGIAGYPAKLTLEKSKDDWKLVEGGDGYPISTPAVESYLTLLKELRAQDFHAEDKSTPGTLAKFGLTKPTFDLELFNKDAKPFFTLEMSKPGEHGDAFAVSSDLKPVTSIFKMAADRMYRRADDFYDKKAPFVFKTEDAAKVVINAPGLKATFEKKEGAWSGGPKVAEMLDKLSHAEALRVFETVSKKTPELPAQLTVFKADGSELFKLSWGTERIEKANAISPEARYILGQTNQVDRVLGLSDHVEEHLGLAGLNSTSSADSKDGASSKPAPTEHQTKSFHGTDGVQSGLPGQGRKK